jgi:hypothetical protein
MPAAGFTAAALRGFFGSDLGDLSSRPSLRAEGVELSLSISISSTRKWHSESELYGTIRAAAAAISSCNAIFHNRQGLEFEPPPSAVINNSVAFE